MREPDSSHISPSRRAPRSSQSAREPRRDPRSGRPRQYDNRPGIIRFFCDKRTHYAFGALLLIVAIVMLVMAFSHLRNGSLDQSAAASQSISQMADSQEVHNAGGALGAKLSHLLLTEGFGVGAFALVIYLAGLGLKILRLAKIRFWPFTFKCLYTAVAVSIILGLLTLNSDSATHWGGRHGHEINLWFEHIGSFLLSWGVSIALAAVLCCIYLNQLTKLIRGIRSRIPKRKSKEQPREYMANTPDRPTGPTVDFDSDDQPGFASSIPDTDFPEQMEEPADEQIVDHTIQPSEDSIDDISEDLSERPEDLTDYSDYSDNSDQPDDHPDVQEVPGLPEVQVVSELSEPSASVAETVIPAAADMPFDPRAELSRYRFPSLDLLQKHDPGPGVSPQEQEENKQMLVQTLSQYKIDIADIRATVGPTVTLFEIVPAEGVRIAQIKRLEDDIARSLAALGIRIIAPIPGKGTVGIEVPNKRPQMVALRDLLASRAFRDSGMQLPVALGKNIDNEPVVQDLADMPHLLVAGATGQGKSVGLNCILCSLLYAKHPTELKLVLIDPKKVEFSLYESLEHHYLAHLEDSDPVVTDVDKAAAVLASLCIEMDDRYELLKRAKVNKITDYNRKIINRTLPPIDNHRYLPYIVVVIDEYADLVMMGGKEIPVSVARLAQKARAVGMHIILATQRPSTDVITGMIKANFPGRMAFKVSQAVDSKTILDRMGANQLIGRGDMLFRVNGPMVRAQCAFVSTTEIENITSFVGNQTGLDDYILPEAKGEENLAGTGLNGPKDAMFDECARFIVTQPGASTSSLQRRFGIGYNKAGKIMDQMEALGIIGPPQGQRPRTILVSPETLEDILRTT